MKIGKKKKTDKKPKIFFHYLNGAMPETNF